jgi:hypothetical protein
MVTREKAQEGLLHERGWLHGVILPFAAEVPAGEPL